MEWNAAAPPDIMDVVGKNLIAPLEQCLLLVHCFRDGVDEFVRRIGTSVTATLERVPLLDFG